MNACPQHCVTYRSSLNMPASVEAMCDLLEEVVKLNPSLIQVRGCFFGLSIVLHHCMWHLKALMQTTYSNSRDADLRTPTLEDLTNGLCCHKFSQTARFRHAASDT